MSSNTSDHHGYLSLKSGHTHLSVGTASTDSDLKEPLLSKDIAGPISDDLEEQKALDARKRSLIGYTLMLMFVVSNSVADSASKILFINHADLGVMEMLFLRGVIVLVLLVFLIGKDAKLILYTSIPRNMYAPLLIRCMSGLLAFFCLSSAIKHLPIVLVALFQNTMPLFTSLFGFLILGERISKSEIFCLILAFYGVYSLLYSN